MLGSRIQRERRGCPNRESSGERKKMRERERKEEERPRRWRRGGSRRSVLPCNLLTAGPRLSISWHNSGMGPSDPENVIPSRGTGYATPGISRCQRTLRRSRASRFSRLSFLNGEGGEGNCIISRIYPRLDHATSSSSSKFHEERFLICRKGKHGWNSAPRSSLFLLGGISVVPPPFIPRTIPRDK